MGDQRQGGHSNIKFSEYILYTKLKKLKLNIGCILQERLEVGKYRKGL